MILAPLIQNGWIGKTAVALRRAGERAQCSERVTIVDVDAAIFARHLTIDVTPESLDWIKIAGLRAQRRCRPCAPRIARSRVP